jgi:hypothetical protein
VAKDRSVGRIRIDFYAFSMHPSLLAANAHANPPAPRTRGANPKTHPLGDRCVERVVSPHGVSPMYGKAYEPSQTNSRVWDASEARNEGFLLALQIEITHATSRSPLAMRQITAYR